MSVIKKMADTIEEYPNVAQVIIGVLMVGVSSFFMKRATDALLEDVRNSHQPSLTLTPKQ